MKKILPIFLIVVIILFVILAFIIPSFSESALKKRKELALLLSEEKTIPQAAQLLASKSQHIALLESSFPNKAGLIGVVQYLDTLSAAAGVAAELHFASEEFLLDEKRNAVIPVDIVVEGNFENIRVFLDSLHKGKYFFKVTLIEGDTPKGLRGVNRVTVKANLYAAQK